MLHFWDAPVAHPSGFQRTLRSHWGAVTRLQTVYIYMVNISEYTVKAMAITYNWLFLWDYTFYQWGDLLVLITGISGHSYKYL